MGARTRLAGDRGRGPLPARARDLARPGPDRVIRVTPIRGDRTDVAAAYPEVPPDIDCHFESLVGVIGMTPEFELRLMVVLEDGTPSRDRIAAGAPRASAHRIPA